MALKVYLKKGNLNYKERKYVSAIQKAMEGQGANESNFNPATNFSELEELYNRYCVEDAQYVEVKETKGDGDTEVKDTEAQHQEFRKGMENSVEVKDEGNSSDNVGGDDTFIDPFNRAQPKVRDYVLEKGLGDGSENTQATKTEFGEPTTEKQGFELPKDDDNGGGSGKSGGKKEKPKYEKPDPVNPNFDEMSNAKKRRSTKKMAKAIVEGVCKLAEFGCIWWVTKDITEDKLVEYEINDTMDLQILLSLDENTQVTLRQWFTMQVKTADQVLRIDEKEKEDLVDSLYEVMLEKGIAPTPMQELIINAVSTIVIGLGTKAFAMSQQINSILQQVTLMRKEQKESYGQENYQPSNNQQSGATTQTASTTENTGGDNVEDMQDGAENITTFENDKGETVIEENQSTDLIKTS